MRKGIVWNAVVTLGLALGATSANADDFIGFYAGAGFGSSSIDDDVLLDDSDSGFKAFAGYTLNEFLSLELAYIDGGEVSDTMDFGIFTTTAEADVSVFNLSVVGNLQLTERFALIGRFGYASIDTDASITLNDPVFGPATFTDDGSEEEISYGAGAVYSISENFQIRAEYEGFDVPDGTMDFISLSALFRFRL